jgi:hypothetical protein
MHAGMESYHAGCLVVQDGSWVYITSAVCQWRLLLQGMVHPFGV